VNAPLLLPELEAVPPELELLVPPEVLPPPLELVPELPPPLLLELPLNEDDEDEPPSTPAPELPPLSSGSVSGFWLAQLAATVTIAMSVADTIPSPSARLILAPPPLDHGSSSRAAVGATPHAWALSAPGELVRAIFQATKWLHSHGGAVMSNHEVANDPAD
jgi:hypothetical protein